MSTKKTVFLALSVIVILVTFFGLIAGTYWVLMLPAILLIGFWITR